MLNAHFCLIVYGTAQVAPREAFMILPDGFGENPATVMSGCLAAEAKRHSTSIHERNIIHGKKLGATNKGAPATDRKIYARQKRSLRAQERVIIIEHLTDIQAACTDPAKRQLWRKALN